MRKVIVTKNLHLKYLKCLRTLTVALAVAAMLIFLAQFRIAGDAGKGTLKAEDIAGLNRSSLQFMMEGDGRWNARDTLLLEQALKEIEKKEQSGQAPTEGPCIECNKNVTKLLNEKHDQERATQNKGIITFLLLLLSGGLVLTLDLWKAEAIVDDERRGQRMVLSTAIWFLNAGVGFLNVL